MSLRANVDALLPEYDVDLRGGRPLMLAHDPDVSIGLRRGENMEPVFREKSGHPALVQPGG
jgi:hypothetical protein